MPVFSSSPTPTAAAIAAAVAAIGGVVAPLPQALQGLGWPYRSRSAIHARRVAGTLPVTPRRLGGRWVVYARDAARLFEAGSPHTDESPSVASSRRGPGRPRKRTSTRNCDELSPRATPPAYPAGGAP